MVLTEQKEIRYIDYQGNELPNHDGTYIVLPETKEIQYFDINGQGFLHDGAPIKMTNGKTQFFLHDGRAIIHDGTPLRLRDGQTQFFTEDGYSIWPVDVERVTKSGNEQREIFFKTMLEKVNRCTPLTEAETEDLRLALLAAEHPESEDSKNIIWCEDIHSSGLEPISNEAAHLLMNLEVIWVRVLNKYKLRHKEALAARYALTLFKESEKCPLAKMHSAESMLVDELRLELKKAEKFIKPPTDFNPLIEFEVNDKGVLAFDQRVMDYLNVMRKGEGTEEFKKRLKIAIKSSKLEDRIKKWRDPLYMHQSIAIILWHNTVRDKVSLSHKKPPALTLFSWGAITTPFKVKSLRIDGDKIVDHNNNEIGSVKTPFSSEITAIDASTISSILAKKNIEVLKSINFHRLLRWEIKEVTRRYLNSEPDFRKISINGSFKELAHLIDSNTNNKCVQELREIVAWQQQAVLNLGNGNVGHMLTYDIRPDLKDRRKNMLSLYLTDMLLPNFVFSMPSQNQSQRDLRILAPLLDIPPLVTNNNRLHAAQAALQVELCIEMRKRAKEIVEKGGIFLPYDQKIKLAENVGLDLETLPKVFDRWTKDGDDAPKMLEEIEKDVYNLSEHHSAARDFIISAGKMEKSASAAGRKSRIRKNWVTRKPE